MAQPGDDFEMLMQLRLNIDNAMGGINDVWSKMRELASKQVEIKLGIDPDFRAAYKELQDLDKKIEEMTKNMGSSKKKGEELGRSISISMQQIDAVADKAGTAIKKAFDDNQFDKVAKKIDAVKRSFEGLKTPHIVDKIPQLVTELEVLRDNANQATGAKSAPVTRAINSYFREALQKVRQGGRAAKGGASQKELWAIDNESAIAVTAAKDLAKNLSQEQGRDAYDAYVRSFEALLKLEKEMEDVNVALYRAKKDKNKEAIRNLTASKKFLESTGVSMSGVMEKGFAGVSEQAGAAESIMRNIAHDGFEKTMSHLIDGFVGGLKEKKDLITPKQEKELIQHFKTQYAERNDQVLNMMFTAAKQALGPMATHLNMGGGAATMPHMDPAAMAQLMATMKATGGVPGVGGGTTNLSEATVEGVIRASSKAFITSVNKIIRAKNADEKGWPLLAVKASEKVLLASIVQALRNFTRSEQAPIIDLKAEVALPKSGYKVMLNKEHLVKQIQSAFNMASGTLTIRGVKVTSEGTLVSTKAESRKKTADEVDHSLSELMDEHGLNLIRKSRLSQTEREHNRIVTEQQRVGRNATMNNIVADPISALSRFGNPVLTKMANSIKEAIEFTPNGASPSSLENKIELMKKAEESWIQLSNTLDAIVKQLTATGKLDANALNEVTMIQAALRQQLGAKVNAFAPNRKQEGVRRGMSDAEAARQTYLQNVPMFGRDIYSTVSNSPFNIYQEQLSAYKRTLDLVRQYEKEFLAYTHARNGEEQEIARTRVNSTSRELEMSKDLLNMRLLFAQKGMVDIRKFSPQFRSDAEGRIFREMSLTGARGKVSPMAAYDQMSTVLREQFMPLVEDFNKSQYAHRKELLEEARQQEKSGDSTGANNNYRLANRMTDTNFDEIIGHVSGTKGIDPNRAGAILDAYARTMRLSVTQEGEIEKIMDMQISDAQKQQMILEKTREIARERLASFKQEAEVLQRMNGIIDKQKEKMLTLSRFDDLQKSRQDDAYGFKRASRGLSNTLGFYAGGMMVGFMAQNAMRESLQYEKIVSEIQGVMGSKSKYEANLISKAIGVDSQKYGADILETAEAAKTLAQAGYSATEVMRELDYTMIGMRGLGMTIDQMNELQVAIKAVDETITTSALLEKISRVESSYAVSAQNLADAIKISAPFLKQFAGNMRGSNDFVDVTSGMVTTIVEKLRVSGTQAGNALKFTFARLLRPEVLTKLQGEFGLKLGTEKGDMLPINEVFGEMSDRYKELKAEGGPKSVKADQMLSLIAGAHRVNYLAALLSDYDKAVRIATESSDAFGESQHRADLVMDTMSSKVQQARNAFQLWANDLEQHSLVAEGFKGILESITGVLGGVSGQGGGLMSTLILGGAGAAAWKIGRNQFDKLSVRRDAGILGVEPNTLYSMIQERKRNDLATRFGVVASGEGAMAARGAGMVSRMLSGLVEFIGPTGVILAGLVGLTSVVGLLRRTINGAEDDTNKFGIKIKNDMDMRMYETPQFRNLEETSRTLGYQTGYSGYQGIRNAALDPNVIAAIASKTGGLSDSGEILKQIRSGKLNGPDIATAYMRAFSESKLLTPEAREALKGINDESERFVFISKMLGEAAFAATYKMEQAVTLMRDSVTRQLEQTTAGLRELDVRGRSNWFSKFFGAMGDFFTNTTTMQDTLGLKLQEGVTSQMGIKSSMGGNYVTPSKSSSDWLTTQEITRKFAGIFKDANVPREVRNALVGQGSIFAQALGLAVDKFKLLGKESVSVADILSKAIDVLNDSKQSYVIKDLVANAKGGVSTVDRMGTGYDYLVSQVGAAGLKQSGFADVAKLIGYTGAGIGGEIEKAPEDKFYEWLDKLVKDAQEYATKQATAYKKGIAPEAFSLKDWAEISTQMKRMALVLVAGADALLIFKNRLYELVASLYMEINRLKADQSFSNRLGLNADPDEARYNLDKQFFTQVATQAAQARLDIAKKQKQMEDMAFIDKNNAGTFEYDGQSFDLGQLMSQEGSDKEDSPYKIAKAKVAERVTKMSAEIALMKQAYQEAFIDQLTTMANALPAGSRSEMMGVINKYFGKDISDVHFTDQAQDFFAGDAQSIRARMLGRKTTERNATNNLQYLERQLDIQKQLDDSDLSMTKRTELKEGRAAKVYMAQMQQLAAQYKAHGLTDEDFNIKSEEYALQLATNVQLDREAQLTENIVNLKRQSLDTMRATVEQTVHAIGDLDAFGAIFQTGADKGEAFRRYVTGIFKGLSSPFADRMTQNLSSNLFEALAKKSGLTDIFNLPETNMKMKIEEAGILAANNMGAAIYANGMIVADMWRQVLGVQAPIAPGSGPAVVGGGSGKPGTSISMGQSLMIGASSMAGQMAGTALGHGTQGAQVGSQFGSVAGTIIGAPGGPVGMAVGSFIGGALGGLVGGLFGDGSKQDRTLHVLEAIAFNTRDQISAIEQSTDRLLRPQSTIFGLPSNFNIPSYTPQFGGAAAGGNVYQIHLGGIQVAPGTKVQEFEVAVERAVAKALNESRASSPRALRRY